MQLKEKHRQGARVRKVYDAPRTPYRRLLEQGVLSLDQQLRLERVYQRTNPVKALEGHQQGTGTPVACWPMLHLNPTAKVTPLLMQRIALR